MSRVIVKFPECREVFVDDKSEGDNIDAQGKYRSLLLGDGLHTFRLGGDQNYTPPSQDVEVGGGTIILPQPVVFEKNG